MLSFNAHSTCNVVVLGSFVEFNLTFIYQKDVLSWLRCVLVRKSTFFNLSDKKIQCEWFVDLKQNNLEWRKLYTLKY